MATLQTQYQKYLKKNPHISYDEWLDMLSDKFLTIIRHDEPRVSDDFQIGPNGAYEHTDIYLINREINFKDTINSLITKLGSVEYDNGDLSDLGNEIGIGLGNVLSELSEDEISMFISGFRHGVSLTNGTHSLNDISDLYYESKEYCISNQIDFLSYDEFIVKLLSDKVFANEYNVLVEKSDLTYPERYKIWFNNNYETGMEYNESIVPDFDDDYYEPTPTKRSILTYKETTLEFYE